jgi:SpoVK/Ycf46/Vps4 family AAA+-type ATPase
MTTLARFSSYWSKSDDLPTVRNMNVLLAGPPGSGKTEFAKYIATHLGRDLLIKRASDLLSMWVGGSEKNLAEAFREAEKSKAILFIDEADSLLYGRESASRSWEVSQVNEFLCQMESLRGMLICATNHMGNFDSAAIRRFNIKINFDYLDDNGKNVFFERFFRRVLGDTPVTVDEERRLRRINNLCPGDYKVAYQKFAFLDAGDIRVTDLLGALEAEVAHKQQRLPRSVGFGIHH